MPVFAPSPLCSLLGSAFRFALRSALLVAPLVVVVAPPALGVAASEAWNAGPHTLEVLEVVRQSQPSSCGPAALATLSAWLGTPRSEAALIAAAHMGPEGVTLSEFARLAHLTGLPGTWYAVPAPGLSRLRAPFVAHLNVDDQPAALGHLVAVASVSHGYVVVGDPAVGAYVQSLEEFSRRYSGRVYALGEQP